MTRPGRRLLAACLAAGLATLLPGIQAPVQAAAPLPDTDPLLVSIDRVTPAAIAGSGPITIAGVVTNSSSKDWSDLRVYPLTSYSPFTTRQELAEAAESDPLAYIGDRRTDELVAIGDLAAGQSTRYRIRVPRSHLLISGDPGVYWLGVQVLGASEGARVDGADGRARVFMTLMRRTNPPATTLALMLPFRGRVLRDAGGHVLAPRAWQRAFSPAGRFGRLVDFSGSAEGFPLTWVVDPAVVDVAGDLARDDPGLDLGPPDEGAGGASASPSPTTTPEEGGGDQGDAGAGDDVSAEAKVVREWLRAFTTEASSHAVLALPYADLDVAGAYLSSYDDTVEGALQIATDTLDRVDVVSSPVIDPRDGALPIEALEKLDSGTPLVLDETTLDAEAPRVDLPGGARITLTATGAGTADPSGGGTRNAPLALRQRILAEAAVHALGPARDEPLVVQLPNLWDPGRAWHRAQFFDGLDQPWLAGVSAAGVIESRSTTQVLDPISDETVRYPGSARPVPAANFVAATNLIAAGRALDSILPDTDAVQREVTKYALLGTSAQLNAIPGRAAFRTRGLIATIDSLLDKVTVTGPSFVTMSSENGPFQVTVTNGLDQPIEVGVEARTRGTDEVTIPPADLIKVPAGQRRAVRMEASSSGVGVWPVALRPITADGKAFGETTELTIRSSHVGQVIWAILGAATLLLVVAIGFRVRRQVRARKTTHGPVLKQRADVPGPT